MIYRFIACLMILWTYCNIVGAQAMLLDENEYWRRLEQTDGLLSQAMNDQTVLSQIDTLWQDVSGVRLNNGRTIALDVAWLQADDDLPMVQKRVRQLLDFRRTSVQPLDEKAALAVLDRVLQEQPLAEDENSADEPDLPPGMVSSPSGGLGALGNLILIGLAVAAAVFVVMRITQVLNVQRAALVPDNPGHDPATSTDAQMMAEQSQSIQDYRAAIRYLYLSLLLFLDEKHIIRYNPTLTNHEHLAQIKDQAALFEQLRAVIQVFDDVWYGSAPANEKLYQWFRQQVERLCE